MSSFQWDKELEESLGVDGMDMIDSEEIANDHETRLSTFDLPHNLEGSFDKEDFAFYSEETEWGEQHTTIQETRS